MSNTAIGDALEKYGVLPEDIEFDIALSKYLSRGGTIERAFQRVWLASKKMPGGGHAEPVREDQSRDADARQPIEGGETGDSMPQGHRTVVSSPSSNRGGEGRLDRAPVSQLRYAIPVREPTASQRAASVAIAKIAAITVMDTLKIDGRPVGDWTVGEARRVGKTKTREGYILTEAARVVANAPGNAMLREVVKLNEMQQIMQRAAEVSDAE